MATEIRVNIGSGNGLVPDSTKPLPEPMFDFKYEDIYRWNLLIWDCGQNPRGQGVNW